MPDRASRLEELRKLSGHSSIAELEKCTLLDLGNRGLASVPPGVWDLTGLAVLYLFGNQLSSLPPEISRLTGLTNLQVHGNLIKELPPQITALTKLQKLWINAGTGQTIRRVPRGITNLPCWNNTEQGDYQHIRALQLYDLIDTATEARRVEETRRAEEARKAQEAHRAEETRRAEEARRAQEAHRAEEARRVEETRRAEEARKAQEAHRAEEAHKAGGTNHNILHEKELQFVQAQKTVHPDPVKTGHKPFAEGEVFLLQSPTATAGSFKVSSTNEEFYIEQRHVEVLNKGCCGNASLKDQHKRRHKLAKIGVALQTTIEPFTIANDEGTVGEQEEARASEAEINACLAGGLCAICFSQFKDPRHLPCNHVFCSECIETSIIASKEEPPFRCPLCSALAYVDEKTVGELNPFTYDSAALGGMNAIPDEGQDKGAVEVLKCRGRKCIKDATHYCIKCGEDGVYCETHIGMHAEVNDESHVVGELHFGAVPSGKKTENCPIHKSIPIGFYCPSCPGSPLKCAECALEDRAHLNEHKKLNQQGFDTKTIITERIKELHAVERKLTPNIVAIGKKIKEVKSQNEKKTSELDDFIKELEDQVTRFKEQTKNQLESLNQSILAPLEDTQKKLLSEMHRIHIAKQTLAKILHKEGSESSLIQTGNALRFTNQILCSKHNTPIHIAPASIVSKIPRAIINDLKKLNDSFMFGLSTTKIEERPEPNDTEKKLDSLHPIITASSTIPAVARASFDSFSSTENIEFPWGICVHLKNGNIYATDEDLQLVRIFDKNLKLLSSHYTGLFIPKTMHGPRGIAISNDGLIAIADCEGHTVKLYVDEFTLVKSIGGQKGSKECLFNRPYSVTFDSEGNLYVADSGNLRVQKFNNKGEFISVIGNQTEEGGLITSLVNGVCVNEEDKLLVLCAGSDQVRVFSKDGAFENYVKLEVPTSIEGWSHIFRASRGVFGVCENKTGAITFYNYEGTVQHRIFLDSCIGACFGLDGALYATSLSSKSISVFSAFSE